MNSVRSLLVVSVAALLLAGCASSSSERRYKHDKDFGPSRPVDVSQVPDAVPKVEPRTRAGNPPSYTVAGKTYRVLDDETGFVERGRASWYGNKFHGEKTSNGETYDMYAMTAAHKTLPIPCYVRVTNLDNNRSVIVRVNDRGPFHAGRVIDLSYAAASKLGYIKQGTAPVLVEAIDPVVYHRQRGDDSARELGSPAHREELAQQKAATIDREIYTLPANTYLQAGAFSQLDSATRLLTKLNALTDFPVQVREKGDQLYRVQIGPISDNRDILLLRELLQKNAIAAPHVVYE